MTDKTEDTAYGKEDPRLVALGAELKAHPAHESNAVVAASEDDGGISKRAGQVLAELIGAPLGAVIIGWLIDHWFGTAPWFLLGMLLLGFIVAGRNIYKLAQSVSLD